MTNARVSKIEQQLSHSLKITMWTIRSLVVKPELTLPKRHDENRACSLRFEALPVLNNVGSHSDHSRSISRDLPAEFFFKRKDLPKRVHEQVRICRTNTLDVLRIACYAIRMIKSYRCQKTQELAGNKYVKKFDSIRDSARSKLDILKAAKGLADLAKVPGNHLEKLTGDRDEQYSIRINEQYRICFTVNGDDFENVEITDYH